MAGTFIEELVGAVRQAPGEQSKTVSATVSRIDDEGVVWVRLAGSEQETPTASVSTEVKRGDGVVVEWRNNKLYIAGNYTNPSVGVQRVVLVEQATEEATETAVGAKKSAEATAKIAGNTAQYFWHTETGTDTGAHITEIPREDFLADPTNGGGNLLARSNGIAVRNGLTELATFGADGVQIGQDANAAMRMTSGTIDIIINNTVIGQIYYDDLTDELVISEHSTLNELRLGTYGASIQNDARAGVHACGNHAEIDGGLYVRYDDVYAVNNAIEVQLSSNSNALTVDWDGNLTCKDITTTNGCDIIKIVESVSLGSLAVNAAGAASGTIDISSSIPSGYKLAAVIPKSTGGYGIYFYTCQKASNTEVNVQLFRVSGSATSANPTVVAICVKV